jgi:hypothetical protein
LEIAMKKFLSSLFIVLLCVSSAVPMSKRKFNHIQEGQLRAEHEIVMIDRDDAGDIAGGGLCTAYAIGPRTLMTAGHCNDEKANRVYVDPMNKAAVKDDQAPSYPIVARFFDHQDHMLLELRGVEFKDIIFLRPEVRLPRQGEHI